MSGAKPNPNQSDQKENMNPISNQQVTGMLSNNINSLNIPVVVPVVQVVQGERKEHIPVSDTKTKLPQEDQNLNYYQEYCRLFIANIVLTTQMKELVSEKNELMNKLIKLEKRSEELAAIQNGEDDESKKKRFRRNAAEIERHYRCSVEQCQKIYGSEGSLSQHMKLKHPTVQYNPKQFDDEDLDQSQASQQQSQV